MTFRDLPIDSLFEFVEGKAGVYEKVSPRCYVITGLGWFEIRRHQAKAADKVRLVERRR